MKKVGGITGVLLLLWATVFALMLPAPARAAAGGKDDEPEAAIRAELDEQVAAWNRGDLKGYMQGYWHSPELTFFAGSRELAGWEAAYQRYRTAYRGKGKEMGRLEFSNIRIEVLGPEAALVRGNWQVTTKNASRRQGLFTVVLKKFGEGWRIIHDHSS